MNTPEYFDYIPVGTAAGFTTEQLEELFQRTLADYRGDLMMAELRMLRTCNAVGRGACTIAQAVAPERDPGS